MPASESLPFLPPRDIMVFRVSRLLGFVLIALPGFALRAESAEAADWKQPVVGFVSTHCFDCHSGDSAEAGLDLARLPTDLDQRETFAAWVKIYDQLQSGQMPPEDAEQPKSADRTVTVNALGEALKTASAAVQQQQGRVQFRRLNRSEYEHTLRDLLALPMLEVAGMLPEDSRAHGFDKVGSALELSYVQLARYLDAADTALAAATVLQPRPEPIARRESLIEANNLIGKWQKEGRDAVEVGDGYGLLRQPTSAMTVWTWRSFTPEYEGHYRVRMQVSAFHWDQGKVLQAEGPQVLSLYAKLGKEKRYLTSFDVADVPEVKTAEVWLRPGEVVEFFLATMQGHQGGRKVDKYSGPGVAFDWLEIEGPVLENWPPESFRRLYGDLPVEPWTPESGYVQPSPPMIVRGKDKRAQRVADLKSPRYMVVSQQPRADAKRLLRRFMEQAFRRPVPAEEVQRYFALVEPKLQQKLPFQEAMQIGYQGVLCSPDFLYFQEDPGLLDDYALASRLSYFLWDSMPDAQLLELAEKGKLSDGETLYSQVERMLADPRSDRFVKSFVGQWLDLREITLTQPDDVLYPQFDQLLLDSMVWETEAYFRQMLRENLGVAHVVDSDFLMINARLGELYNIAGVQGVDIRKVERPPDSVRGGFLTQAAVLKVTANGTTTSPVTRGAWIVDRILGQPVPPPPPNVPAIEPDLRGTTSIREQLATHREIQSCARCHKQMDPPGFALESFDVIGSWRERYRALGGEEPVDETFKGGQPVQYGYGQPVDPSGTMADGKQFENIHGFRSILLEDEEQLAQALVEKLLVYATGAGIQFADHEAVDQIVASGRQSGYGLRTLVHEVVQSPVFRRK